MTSILQSMRTGLSNCYNTAQTYYNDIPPNTLQQMIYSAGADALIHLALTSNLQGALINGIAAGTTSLVHGLVTPLFMLISGRSASDSLTWGEEICRSFSAIVITGYAFAAFGNVAIIHNLYGTAIMYALITLIVDHRRRLNRAAFFCGIGLL